MRPPRPCGSPADAASGGALMPPPQTTQCVRIVVPSASVDVPGRDLGDGDAEVQCGRPCAAAPWPRSRARSSENGASSVWPRSTRWICAAVTARSWYSALIVSWMRSASAPAISTPVGPPPTMTKFSAPLVDQRRVAVGVLEHAEDARAQPLRVVERVERERVLVGARGAEEVRLRAGRQHERVAGRSARPSVVVTVRVAGSIEATSASLTSMLASLAEELAQRVRDVARRELRGRHLVEQRLELVVVVAVDQRDVHVVVLGQPPGAADAGEAAADDDDVPLPVGRSAGMAGSGPAAARPCARAGGRRRAARSPSPSAPGSPRRCSGRSSCRRRRGCRPRAPGSRCPAPRSRGRCRSGTVPAWCAHARDRDVVLQVGVARDEVVVVHPEVPSIDLSWW